VSIYPNICPKCAAKPFAECRTLTTGRKTDAHAERVNGEWPRWCDQHDTWTTACADQMHAKVSSATVPRGA
jgi:hypothetical protein